MFFLLIVGVVVVVPVLYAADRFFKAHARVRRLRTMGERLDAATVRAEKQHERRQQVARASAELTSVMPAISLPPLSLPDEPVPGESVPGEAVPGEAVPGESVPGESVPDDAVADEAGSDAPGPEQTAVIATGPGQVIT